MQTYIKNLAIFAGGKGTRLGSLGKIKPKPVISINNKPLIIYLFNWAKNQGFKKIIVAGGHNFEILKKEIESFLCCKSVKITPKIFSIIIKDYPQILIKDTGEDKETAERLYDLKELLFDEERFVLTYGDTLTNLNILPIIELSKRKNATITFVAGYPDARYGEIILKNNLVTQFNEKERPKFLVNRGFFVIKNSIFENWDNNLFVSFEKNVLPFFVNKKDVYARKDYSWFFSVDTEIDAKKLEEEIMKRDVYFNMEK